MSRKDRSQWGWGEVASHTSRGGLGRRRAPLGLSQWAQGHMEVEVIGGTEANSGGKTAPRRGRCGVTVGAWGRGQVLIRGEEREARGLECLKNASYYEGDEWGQRFESEARARAGRIREAWGAVG